MNNEIKEILEDYKKLAGEITLKLDNTAEYESWLIIQDYFDYLLNYITNLQEKVNQYENPDDMTLMFMWCDEKAKAKIKQLQEENERLKENAEHNDKVVDKAKWNEMIYKSRNEKAIEYIKDDMYCEPNELNGLVDGEHLLNILQGEDNE